MAIARKEKIKDIVFEKKSVTVFELAKKFSVTEETIRRDLKVLESEGILIRTYGGAFIQDGVQNEVKLAIRETAYMESKKIIAEKAKNVIQNGDSIFLDSSTTSMMICSEISNKRLTVLSNSLKIINYLSDFENINLISIGGNFTNKTMEFLGRITLENLNTYFVDKAFISCRSLSMENAISDSSEELSAIRKIAIKRSSKSYVVADCSKFNKNSFLKICDFEDIDGIITDKILDTRWKSFLKEKDVLAI